MAQAFMAQFAIILICKAARFVAGLLIVLVTVQRLDFVNL
jgi:hypothetical protein